MRPSVKVTSTKDSVGGNPSNAGKLAINCDGELIVNIIFVPSLGLNGPALVATPYTSYFIGAHRHLKFIYHLALQSI
ncbi:Uncharacterised protein [Mycobacteroides abscessus subsp. massiliense]|nr:Uncharacterised protein [Mycobacteroides abscessus subsp. massiliense]SKU12890.1 Uncharacterised protein [Mycobacteroides abscessus subsp. massiliense]